MTIHQNPLHDNAITDVMHNGFRLTTHLLAQDEYTYVATRVRNGTTTMLMRGTYPDEPTALRAGKQAVGRRRKGEPPA